MAVTLVGGDGIFDRLGRLGHALHTINTFRGSGSAGYLTKELFDAVETYDGAAAELRRRAVPERLISALATGRNGLAGAASAIRQVAQDTLVAMVDLDTPLAARNVIEAATELRRQMLASSDTLDANEPSVSLAYDSGNAGTGKIVARACLADGSRAEGALPEAIGLQVTRAASAGAETLAARGQAAVNEALDWQWPGGSGGSASLTSTLAAGTANLASGGQFESFTANLPASWTAVTGSAGTHFAEETTNFLVGAKALRYIGDGSTATQLRQNIVANVAAHTPYAVHLFAKMSASPAAGALAVDLFDGSSVINDDDGNANSLAIDLTALGTSWTGFGAVFVLPNPLPTAVWLRIRLSTALSSSRTLYLDELQLKPATRLYQGGPYLAAFTGGTGWAVGDRSTATLANDHRGALATMADRLWGLRTKGLWLPTATSGETISDSLLG